MRQVAIRPLAPLAGGVLAILLLAGAAAQGPSPVEAAADARLRAQLTALSLGRADVMINRSGGARATYSETISFYHWGDAWLATKVQETYYASGDYDREPDGWAVSADCPAIGAQLAALDKLSPPDHFDAAKLQARDLEGAQAKARAQAQGRAILILANEGFRYRLDAPTDKGERIDWTDTDEAAASWIEETMGKLEACFKPTPPKA